MQRRLFIGLGLAILGLTNLGYAADKADPTGDWKYSLKFNDNSIDFALKMKLDGDKLSGTVTRNNIESKLEDATFKDNEVAFTVTREVNGNKITSKYKGKVEKDTIKGKIEFPGRDGGEARSFDWEAKREKK